MAKKNWLVNSRVRVGVMMKVSRTEHKIRQKRWLGHILRHDSLEACFFQLRRLRQIRCLLSRNVTASLVATFILSLLDYCNALLAALPQSTMAPLQRVMNAAAWLVCNLRSRDHVAPALIELHWLPITARVQYKLCLLMHLAAVCTAPDYLKNMLQPVSDRAYQRALRSATNNDMAVPCSRLKFGERAFSIAAPRAWNSIPADLRTTLNTATFKKNLKTFLFRESYSTSWFNSFNLCTASLSIFIFGILYFFVIGLVGLCCKP